MEGLDDLPVAMHRFITASGVHPENYTTKSRSIPRYIRLAPSRDHRTTPTAEDVSAQLPKGTTLETTSIPGVYSLPRDTPLAPLPLYKEGRIYGMDLASVLAVSALNASPDDHVLDLCCAPGAKICFIADLLHPSTGTVTGIDISPSRLSTCRSLCKKYKQDNVRLVVADGTTISLPRPTTFSRTAEGMARRLPIPSHFPSKDNVKDTDPIPLMSPESPALNHDQLYDKVLVDAECTHDGSIAHVTKYVENPEWDAEDAFLRPDRLSTISILQYDLLCNGWRHLLPGGSLVYATCSLTEAQNEEVIHRFLQDHSRTATLLPAHLPQGITRTPISPRFPPTMQLCVRLEPRHARTSGLFYAHILKSAE